MRALAFVALLLVISFPAGAVEDGQVRYLGGTAAQIPAGALGRFDTSSPTAFTFESPAGKLAIPYESILSYRYQEKVAHHLGVLPAVAVGIVRARHRRHFIQIQFRGADDVVNVAIFEVSKQAPQTLLAILQTRSPQATEGSSLANLLGRN
ncbi:MAG TPA: hypothetical protein VL913_01280 [Candidatus Micrarchaeaceae archaeon]|nr:hypothetical protein [Candidatus Micrarchaeaceae archaeon]